MVFTAFALEKRGSCCGCGCRHCPFGHESVPTNQRKSLLQDPWLVINDQSQAPCDVLFWSGGKDSFLALTKMAQEAIRDVVLMTTYDGRTGQVAHQEIHIDQIIKQVANSKST